jgi:hypothetical protein
MDRVIEYQEVLRTARREDNEVLAAFRVGSQVYGTSTPDSDRDYVLVLSTRVRIEDVQHGPKMDIIVRGILGFQDSLRDGNIFSIECVCSPSPLKSSPEFEAFSLKDREHRRRMLFSALEKASSDFNKGLKINDPKRVYHAFRVLDYAHQVFDTGRIQDFTSAQRVYECVMTEPRPLSEAFTKAFEDLYSFIRSKA